MQAYFTLFYEFVISHKMEVLFLFRYDRLEPLIKKSGKTKVFLCQQMGVCKTYLRDAKKQKTNISGDTLRILAEELGTTPEYLKGETDDPLFPEDIKKERPAENGEALEKDLPEDIQQLLSICRQNPALASALLSVAQQIEKGQAGPG